MKSENFLLSIFFVFGFFSIAFASFHESANMADPYAAEYVIAQDTIPIKDRQNDFVTDPSKNPFDLKDPSIIEQNVEYDPATGQYIITEKIGDDYFRMPTYMTFEEYTEWQAKKQEREYFKQLAGVSTGDGKGALGKVDPISKFDIENSLIDRLFGGTEVDIRPQGNIDLTFGVDFQNIENPVLTRRQQRQGGFDFDMNIQMNVDGSIGEKLKLRTNYNTQATFDFENQMKLEYNSDSFSEDEIIKKIEAGNVSLPLRSSLIQGSQSLFGVKLETQFGRLRLTGIASQQKSKRENIQIQGGSQLQEFEVRADEYDENRHFFLSHYNRDAFEGAINSLPVINSLFKINRVEVWVTNDRNVTEDTRDIVGIVDLGEPRLTTNDNPSLQPPNNPIYRDIFGNNALPDNDANPIYRELINTPNARLLDNAVATLTGPRFNFQQSKDFEKVRARKLSPTEYYVHPELGFISLNVNLRPDQVLGIAYEYTYNGKNYTVGEFSNDIPISIDSTELNVLYVKMLKSTTPRVDLPTWDLMMKNIYAIGAFQVDRQDFKLDIHYEDPGGGEKRFLPEEGLTTTPLLRVFNLDRLNTQLDPIPDGIFDFVDGVTINTRNGRIMFPVLEPFGSDLGEFVAEATGDPRKAQQYAYNMLYDSTVTQAREFPEFNRFMIRGSYKSSISSEISLGSFNLPRGSIRVRAGGQVLEEGRDFEVDYNIGRIKILNESILNSGVPINISFEDNTLFGFQTKTMLGVRADYEVNKNFNIGGTYMHLFERPFTRKVNIGDDPINNRIFGLDINFSEEAPWLTKIVDKIPLIDTKAPSSISFMAEGAFLKPGHSKAINQEVTDGETDKGGAVYIDDFEGSASSFDLRTPANNWVLASVPQNDRSNNNPFFPESQFIDSTITGVNRALLNWYRIDQSRGGVSGSIDSYTKRIDQREVFPNLELEQGRVGTLQSLDLTYYPGERGPYNFDLPDGGTQYSEGLDNDGNLVAPETRWAGIMRSINNNDFEAANIEFVEIWMLNPFMEKGDGTPVSQSGDLYLNLGNISEDILRDSRRFFENGLFEEVTPDRTVWGKIPRTQAITNAFDNDPEVREKQDVGLDGLNDEEELNNYKPILDIYRNSNMSGNAIAEIEADPSNDNFRFFRDYPDDTPVLERYRQFNGPEGNSQSPGGGNQLTSATNIPDTEDLNKDNTLNETESYFQYRIPIVKVDENGIPTQPGDNGEGELQFNEFVTDSIHAFDTQLNETRIWYRIKVPLTQFSSRVGGIQDFRSIRFIRMYLKNFNQRTTLRFGRLELVRNQWRRYRRNLVEGGPNTVIEGEDATLFDVNAVNIEENSKRTPFNYVLPPGIQREQSLGAFPNVRQNEQSLSLDVCNLSDGDARAIYKILNLDMRVFNRLRMFVHAESMEDIQPGELTMFMRLGSDFEKNYYEYEIPITLSDEGVVQGLSPFSPDYVNEVWRPENSFDFDFTLLKDLKIERNAAGTSLSQLYEAPDPNDPNNIIKVRGNPNLGLVKGIMIGVRNKEDDGLPKCAEIWINELRVNGFDERGGSAALARLDMQLADFGTITLSGNYSSIGWGSLDQKVAQRAREEVIQYDVAGSFELGKFLPEESGIRIPMYTQFSKTLRTPEFDPYDYDIPLKEKIAAESDRVKRDSIRDQAADQTEIKSINFTNVRKERTNTEKTPMPWDISNFSFTYAYTQTTRKTPLIEEDQIDQYRGAIDYNYALRPNFITPFKKLSKSKHLRLITDFNFNPFPNSFTFSTQVDRQKQRTKYRFAGDLPQFNTFFDKRFNWDRNYDLNWDLSKGIKFNYSALNNAIIDELQTIDPEDGSIIPLEARKDFIWDNVRNLGRTKNFSHNFNINYTAPFKQIPLLDWINVKAQYSATYDWNTNALWDVENLTVTDSLGNVIQNSQNRQINADFNFDKLYDKWKYLAKINKPKRKAKDAKDEKPTNRPSRTRGKEKEGEEDEKEKKKKDREPSTAERIVIRPLMSLRKARISYAETFRTVVPGFTPTTKFFGLSEGFDAPGWAFVGGIQPNIETNDPNENWLDQAAESGWITDNVFQNQQVLQNYTQSFDAKITVEPFKDFRIDIDANRSFTENHTEFFKDTVYDDLSDIVHAVPRDVGSFTTSFFAMNTLFENDIFDVFKRFENNRIVISDRLATLTGQGTGEHEIDELYREGYGRYQQDVLIPAFLAAYTNKDINTIDIAENYAGNQLFNILPKLNWRLSYNGLSKLAWFEEIFSSVNLTHGYRSTLTVNQFNTDLEYLEEPNGLNPTTFSYYSRFEIPGLVIAEQFSPLLGLDMKLKNDMSFRVDMKKARNLAMSFIDYQLSETKTSEYTVGFGYRMQNVVIPFLQGGKTKKKKRKSSRSKEDDPNEPRQEKGSDLNFKFDFSLRDDITVSHLLDQNTRPIPTRGLRTIRISPSADYDVNKQLNIRLFFDYSKTEPKTSASFPITNFQGGVTVRFSLN